VVRGEVRRFQNDELSIDLANAKGHRVCECAAVITIDGLLGSAIDGRQVVVEKLKAVCIFTAEEPAD